MGDVVKSAERVLAIFEVFEAERRPLRISELVSRLEIPQSSTSTLMKTLVARGLVEFDPEHRTFKPTVRLAFLGNWVVGSTDGLAQIQSLAHRLSIETGEMVHSWLSEWALRSVPVTRNSEECPSAASAPWPVPPPAPRRSWHHATYPKAR